MLLNPSQVGKHYAVTSAGVRKWIREGKLKAFTTPGGQYRIQEQDLVQFLTNHSMPVLPEVSKSKKRVLVVDDDRNILEVIHAALAPDTSLGVTCTDNGYDACILAGTLKPDLVLLDIMMPGINGFEVCRRLKTNPQTSNARVLVITGFPDKANIDRITEAGADHWLKKPFQIDVLVAEVNRLLGVPAMATP